MGSQGPGRKRTPSKNGLTAEEDALNVIAKEAEARLAAKRAARAEAREIRMRELERQQKEIYQVQKKYYGLDNLDNKWGDIEQWMEDSERYTRVSRRHASVSDDEERMSVGSRSNIRLDLDAAGAYGGADDRLERDYLEKGSSRASTISGATLTSLGGTSSRRGSGDTSISADTEASIREIKEIHELKDQIQDVEAKHMQNLKDLKDSLLEVEEKYRKAMVSNAQLDNEKTNMMYEVDTLKDSLMELEEMLFETRRELEEKCKDLEREKHAHSILQFQFSELKETLKQSEELLTEIRQLRLKQDGYVREISDLQETIDWKNKKIGALERQKEFSDAIRNERDELRDEVVQLKDILKKHGIVLGPDLATNGETEEEVGKADQNSQTTSAEIREGSSVLGTHQLKVCKDQQQKDLDEGVPGNQQFSHAPFSSTNTPLEANENGDLGEQMNQGVEQLENKPEEHPNSVGDEITAIRPNEEIKSEVHKPEDSRDNTMELECIVHKNGLLETDQQDSECVKPSQDIKEETPSEFVSGSVHDEPDKPGGTVLDDKLKEEPVESSQTEKLAKTQGASATNKKKKKKKKNKQKHKQSDMQENDTKIDDKSETVCNEDKPNQKTEGDLEGNHQEPLRNDVSETTMNTDVTHDVKGSSELGGIETSTNINADDVRDKILLVTDEADLAGISKTISNFDCPECSNDILSDDLSSNVISNPANIIDEHNEDSTNPDSVAVVFSCELVSSETETSLPHELTVQSMDAVEGGVESISCSENIEKSSSVDKKEGKSHLNCELEEREEKVQNIDLDEISNHEDQDDSAHSSPPVIEVVENEAERVILEQPIDQPMENQPEDSIGAELDQEVVERQDDLDKENHKVPTENVFYAQDSIGAELEQEEVERQDDLDKEKLKVPTENVFDAQDGIGAELDQKLVERQDDLDKENYKLPTENVFDAQDSIGAELEQEEVERQDDLDKEKLKVPTENVSDGSHVDNTSLTETQVQFVHEDHLSPNKTNKELVGKSDSSDQEPKVEKDEEERSIQNQLEVQLPENEEDLLVKSDVAAQELKEEDEEEEDEGESFDFDEMDLEASSDPPQKNFQDQPKEEGTLFKDDVQEAKQEYQSNVTDEDQTQEHLELADQESKPKEQKDDGNTKKPQTATVTEGCLTEDSQISSEVRPNDQQHDTSGNEEDAFEERQKSSENAMLSEGVNLISEMETRNVGQEINTSIQHENKVSSTSGDQEVEKETTERNKEDERKESKKSGKGKGKGKGKEECKMS